METRIGKHLKELRKKRGLSLRKLGEGLNADYTYLSRIENGIHKPSIDFLEQVAKYFNVDISYFFMSDELLDTFEQNEKELIFERELTPEVLIGKYNFKVDGTVATEEEINEAIKYIKALRMMNKIEKHPK